MNRKTICVLGGALASLVLSTAAPGQGEPACDDPDPKAGDCTVETLGIPGCTDPECCKAVCGDEPFCCSDEWDQTCVDLGFGEVYRYGDQSIEAAIIQKLARVVSGLDACIVLLESGFVQELGALQRILDALDEDIFFLCQPLLGVERTELHNLYLDAFY